MQAPSRRILLTPGPATTTDAVKFAQVVPDICPRETEFAALMRGIVEDLPRLIDAPADARAILLCGSGTAAVEAMIGSLTGANGLLVINNGAYGERILRIARILGLPSIEFGSDPTAAIDIEGLGAALASRPSGMRHLAIVHHETTTGLLNDLVAVGALCRRHGVQLLVDAMSSFAAVPIDMAAANIAGLAASANKNLQGMAGASFVIARADALAMARQHPPRSLYFDLAAEEAYFSTHGQMRFTAPVQSLYALRQALDETLAETVAIRRQRYDQSWTCLIDGLEARGFVAIVPRELQSRLITAIDAGDIPGFEFEQLHDYLFARGITIYPGKIAGRETFRIANIGAIDSKDITRFLDHLDAYLASCRQ
jgi:2-aminoethylphosphonate-pyruvate transaminase